MKLEILKKELERKLQNGNLSEELAATVYVNYEKWLNSPMREEVENLKNLDVIIDSFCKDLEFGTAGLREVMAPGPNKLNVITVKRATQGLANEILSSNTKDPQVAIAFDTRHNSLRFALEAANVLAANNIKVNLFYEPTPVPVLSFAVNKLKTDSGIVITASHNPGEYNGYKVYGSNAAQLGVDNAKIVAQRIYQLGITDAKEIDNMRNLIDSLDFDKLEKLTFKELKEFLSELNIPELSNNMIQPVSDQLKKEFIKKSVNRDIVPEGYSSDMHIVYTPFFGTGGNKDGYVIQALKELGLKEENIHIVESQANPNPDFPGVKAPNPEDPNALQEARQLAEKLNKQDPEHPIKLIMGTDPDADRIGVEVLTKENTYKHFSGDHMFCLLLQFIVDIRIEKGLSLENSHAVKSMVTTELSTAIAEKNGIEMHQTDVGFKNIAAAKEEIVNKGGVFLLGGEESCGYSWRDDIGDKDAVGASTMVSHAVQYYLDKGKTLDEVLETAYEKYGYYFKKSISIPLKDSQGIAAGKRVMETFRCTPPDIGSKILETRDYKEGTINNVESPTMPLEKSNVLYYKIEEGWTCLRPSGTEPKAKEYVELHSDGPLPKDTQEKEKVKKEVENREKEMETRIKDQFEQELTMQLGAPRTKTVKITRTQPNFC